MADKKEKRGRWKSGIKSEGEIKGEKIRKT